MNLFGDAGWSSDFPQFTAVVEGNYTWKNYDIGQVMATVKKKWQVTGEVEVLGESGRLEVGSIHVDRDLSDYEDDIDSEMIKQISSKYDITYYGNNVFHLSPGGTPEG